MKLSCRIDPPGKHSTEGVLSLRGNVAEIFIADQTGIVGVGKQVSARV